MNNVNLKEIGRQLAHFSGLGAVYFAYVLGAELTGISALVISLGLFIFSYYVRIKKKIRKKLPIRIKKLEELEDGTHNLINSLEREKAIGYYDGAILFFLGIGVSLLIFPLKIAILSIIVLSVGDSFSTLIGVHFGKHKTKINPPKSYEGTVGGLVASFLVCLFFTNPLIALIASGVGMLMELLPIRINDNVLMPLCVGFVIFTMSYVGFII